MSVDPPRRRAVMTLPPDVNHGQNYGETIGRTVEAMLTNIGAQGDCDWRTLIITVRRTEELGGSGLPDLLSASVVAVEPEADR